MFEGFFENLTKVLLRKIDFFKITKVKEKDFEIDVFQKVHSKKELKIQKITKYFYWRNQKKNSPKVKKVRAENYL